MGNLIGLKNLIRLNKVTKSEKKNMYLFRRPPIFELLWYLNELQANLKNLKKNLTLFFVNIFFTFSGKN